MTEKVVANEDILRETLFGNNPYAKVLIAEIDSMPIGFVVFFFTYSTYSGRPGIYILNLYVRHNYRGCGIGRKLIKYCINYAKKFKCGRVEWSVLKWNPARKFYEHLGAKILDKYLVYRIEREDLDVILNSDC